MISPLGTKRERLPHRNDIPASHGHQLAAKNSNVYPQISQAYTRRKENVLPQISQITQIGNGNGGRTASGDVTMYRRDNLTGWQGDAVSNAPRRDFGVRRRRRRFAFLRAAHERFVSPRKDTLSDNALRPRKSTALLAQDRGPRPVVAVVVVVLLHLCSSAQSAEGRCRRFTLSHCHVVTPSPPPPPPPPPPNQPAPPPAGSP